MAGGGLRVCGAATLNAAHVLIVNTVDRDPVTGTVYAGGLLDQIEFNTIGDITLGPQDSGAYQGLSIYQPVADAMTTFSTASYNLPSGAVLKLASAVSDTDTFLPTSGNPMGTVNVGDLIFIDTPIPGEEMRVEDVNGAGLFVTRGNDLLVGSETSRPHAATKEIKKVTGAKCDGRSEALTDILWKSIGPLGNTTGLNGLTGSIYAPHPYSLFADSVSGSADLAIMTGCLFINGADSTFTFQPELHAGAGSVSFLGQWG
jgi:hypothetical protein